MNPFNIKLVALLIGFAVSAGAMAQAPSKAEYKASKSAIGVEYTTAKTNCAPLSGNAKDLCSAGANGRQKIAKAELEASYRPTVKNHYKARVAKAEADYGVAIELCDDRSGNAKDVCVKEAKAAQTDGKADALAQLTTARANAAAKETAAEARSEADVTAGEARKQASAEKTDAQYKVDIEKCAVSSGTAKDECMNKAKRNAGR